MQTYSLFRFQSLNNDANLLTTFHNYIWSKIDRNGLSKISICVFVKQNFVKQKMHKNDPSPNGQNTDFFGIKIMQCVILY